jgi:hypothetical protein
MMDVRVITEHDYDNILKPWWKAWKWEAPSKDMLPDNGTGGVIVSKNGVDICAGYMYYTNSSMAWLEYIVSNMEYKEKDRKEAIEFLINVLSAIAQDKGFKYIYASLKNVHLIKKYENCGFIKGDENCKEMVKIL